MRQRGRGRKGPPHGSCKTIPPPTPLRSFSASWLCASQLSSEQPRGGCRELNASRAGRPSAWYRAGLRGRPPWVCAVGKGGRCGGAAPAQRPRALRPREGLLPRIPPGLAPPQPRHSSVSATTRCLAEWPFLEVAWPVPFS